jgi:peptide/nickel transport system substrate-binding protein
MEFGVHGGSCDMFENYDNPLGTDKTAPVGKPAVANFVRWQDGGTDRLLKQLGSSPDEATQKQAVAGLQKIMVEQVPTVPLWYGARWFQYRTKSAVGWPSAQDPYAAPGDQLKMMTQLKPASQK